VVPEYPSGARGKGGEIPRFDARQTHHPFAFTSGGRRVGCRVDFSEEKGKPRLTSFSELRTSG
jgi:hypothetical protein